MCQEFCSRGKYLRRYIPRSRYTHQYQLNLPEPGPPQDQVHPPGPGTLPPEQGTPPGPGTPLGPGTSPRSGTPPWNQVHRPRPGTPPGKNNPPGALHAGRYGQQEGGTHPTGMHSFLN